MAEDATACSSVQLRRTDIPAAFLKSAWRWPGVAMMAALGAVVQHYVKFPGFDSVPSGLAASITAPGSYGFVALFAVAGILELVAWTESPEKELGS